MTSLLLLAGVTACMPHASAPMPKEHVTLRGDGAILVERRPFFPFGYYHVSWARTRHDRLKDIDAMAREGFNTVHVSLINNEDADTYDTFLDTMAKRGMYVITEGMPLGRIANYRDKKAVLGWNIADDSNSRYTPSTVEGLHRSLKAVAPHQLSYATLYTAAWNRQEAFFGTSDAIGNMSYPIGGDDISAVYPRMRIAVEEAARHGTVPIANLQTFSWSEMNGTDKPDFRWPTPQEVANMTYQSFMAGVKGVLYYSYLDAKNDVRRQPRVWEETGELAREARSLAPFLMDGQRIALREDAGAGVVATAWRLGTRRVVAVLSTSPKLTATVDLALPFSGQALVPLFAERARGLRLEGGRVRGSVGPLDVHVYEVR